jgi:superfamily I DNA/RNA helicase
MTLPDKAARTTALTDIDHSFLVEAGAGSGKTSIMAGRVAVLFARGVRLSRFRYSLIRSL